ncbi:PqqD family protein [Brevibacillus gelatini]|uniref:PqqD family protein n=1 Tax=Brevibacillus gelatini TaxID=1655277 RepID=UPI003D813BA5
MIVSQREEIYTTEMGDEIVLLDMRHGAYYGLEGATMELWKELADGPVDSAQILAKWTQLYQQSEEELTSMLDQSIQELISKKLIVVSGHDV